jgi:hypothetical protein
MIFELSSALPVLPVVLSLVFHLFHLLSVSAGYTRVKPALVSP